MGLLTKIFGTHSEREIKKIRPIVDQILAYEDEMRALSDSELQAKTPEFKERLERGETVDDILPEAFAVVREAGDRVLKMRHFPVQLLGGIVLHQGRIAEMKTGEGKTLVATLPLYLNALEGKGCHLVTVNDYLATRDSEWMGKIFKFLGLSVGLIVHGKTKAERREAYAADITYGTNNEFGFDYLRDNMVNRKENLAQRELNFAIVDEVDSILIDEARTPLIISGQGDASSDLYTKADQFVRSLQPRKLREVETREQQEALEEIQEECDYIIDEKNKTSILSRRGVRKAEKFFGIENLSDQENYKLNHHINNALKAHGTMFRDTDYVVADDEVIIVDDFTGRLMQGRRYSNGLHQAIEAKEGVKVQRESRTLATITFQNYFRMYKKLSGMTGTALTEEDEFRAIYELDCIEIPTNKPIAREDLADAVFKSEAGKYRALIEQVKELHAKGQPILVGTVSVDRSELLSQLFKREALVHNVLNAKHHEREAEIVAQAGRLGAITIATNMAGRGTDIVLGGNPEHMAKQEMRKQGYSEDLIEQANAFNETNDQVILDARAKFRELEAEFKKETEAEKEAVIAAGGLCILGTERHESRRIDNQLRGRSGRQGDAGVSKFYLSLEDDLMRLFGGERMQRMFETLRVDEDMEIQNPMLSRGIESAQRKVEAQNFAIRKHVLEYDNVMNQQRDIVYKQRKEVLAGKDLHDWFLKTIYDLALSEFSAASAEAAELEDWDHPALKLRLNDLFGDLDYIDSLSTMRGYIEPEELAQGLLEAAKERLVERTASLEDPELVKEIERYILLTTVDNHWMDHIDAMDDLRDSIGMRGYAQHDPVVEYQKEGSEMFLAMNEGIKEDAVRLLMRAHLAVEERKERSESGLKAVHRSSDNAFSGSPQMQRQAATPQQSTPVRRQTMPGRNDPCWCGSGKKYKNCHLREDEQKLHEE
ncbi:MAG: preprotein translocase subunit SecA [Eubacteriales bacterium]|nr:preprotein translocase subunit SecA [Eubacteriales bacterium]